MADEAKGRPLRTPRKRGSRMVGVIGISPSIMASPRTLARMAIIANIRTVLPMSPRPSLRMHPFHSVRAARKVTARRARKREAREAKVVMLDLALRADRRTRGRAFSS